MNRIYVYVEGANGLYEPPDMDETFFYTELGSNMGGTRHSIVSIVLVDGAIQAIWSDIGGAEKYKDRYMKANPDAPEPTIEHWQVWQEKP